MASAVTELTSSLTGRRIPKLSAQAPAIGNNAHPRLRKFADFDNAQYTVDKPCVLLASTPLR
jgi:hypothetical protein